MRIKKFLAIFVLSSLALVFLHSEFGLACECHGDHEDHDFNHIISNTLISKSSILQDVNYPKVIVTYQIVNQIVEFEYLVPVNFFYKKPLNHLVLKLPTFSFLQSFLF